jgi:hypothetical protein
MGLVVEESRSFIKMRNREGDKTAPCGTPKLVRKVRDVDPSTTVTKERSVR